MTIEPNDTIFEANDSGLSSSNPGIFFDSGFIGDNPDVLPTEDVDLIGFQLDAGNRVTIDLDAAEFGSELDSVLRLFDSVGNELVVSDDDPAPEEDFTLDSYIDFTAEFSDTYYVGVSSFANFGYDPFVEGSGFGSSTGEYDLEIFVESIQLDNRIENGGFETGTFSNWRTIGDTSVETADFGIAPSEGTFQALLTTGANDSGGSVVDSDLENFLELSSGVLDNLGNGNATEGSGIKQTFTAEAGDILTFDWNFLTNEGEQSFFNDFAFFSISPFTLELADTGASLFETFAEGFDDSVLETGYQSVSVAISEAGTYTLNFGVVDVEDDAVDSGLLVDNIQVLPSLDFDEEIPIEGFEADILPLPDSGLVEISSAGFDASSFPSINTDLEFPSIDFETDYTLGSSGFVGDSPVSSFSAFNPGTAEDLEVDKLVARETEVVA